MCLGIPGEIVALSQQNDLRFATVRFGGITREVCLECQPDATVGEWVLVHVGFAIARLDRADAERTLELLRALGPLDEEEAT
jgi:hydrogenase expression/formation protein HypC